MHLCSDSWNGPPVVLLSHKECESSFFTVLPYLLFSLVTIPYQELKVLIFRLESLLSNKVSPRFVTWTLFPAVLISSGESLGYKSWRPGCTTSFTGRCWPAGCACLFMNVFPLMSSLGKCHLCSYSFHIYLTPEFSSFAAVAKF